ncbi:MAG TPA: dipeptidase [Terriglobales bacterium]|nr:dipeptidase [Terriglobales bacterium]
MRLSTFAAVLLLTATSVAQSTPTTAPAQSKKKTATAAANWKAVHQSAIIVDTHADTTGRFLDEHFDPSNDAGFGHWDLARAKKGNLGAEFFSIWVDPEKFKGQYVQRAMDMIDSVYQTVAKHPNEMVMAYSAADIRKARTGPHKRIAALIGLEGGHPIEGDMGLLRDYYRLGVRYMTLTWSNSLDWAQSSGDYKKDENGKIIDPGMTDYGRKIVQEMNRLGMMVDISHVSDRTFYNALTASRAPVIASHSSARALTDVPRNMTDDMLVALARNNGVVQVNFNCGFISNKYNDESKQFAQDHPEAIQKLHDLEKQYNDGKIDENQLQDYQEKLSSQIPRPPLSDLIDHIDHIAKVAGVSHVGIGSDFDGVPCLPQGIDSVADLPKITEALAQRGYTPKELDMILGGNLLRVFADVERTAREIQAESNKDTREVVPIPPKQ